MKLLAYLLTCLLLATGCGTANNATPSIPEPDAGTGGSATPLSDAGPENPSILEGNGMITLRLLKADGQPYNDYSRVRAQVRPTKNCVADDPLCTTPLYNVEGVYLSPNVPVGEYTLEFYWYYGDHLQIRKNYTYLASDKPVLTAVVEGKTTDLGTLWYDLPSEVATTITGVAKHLATNLPMANTEFFLAAIFACNAGDVYTGTGTGCSPLHSSGDRSITTDANGNFIFNGLPQGMYVVYTGNPAVGIAYDGTDMSQKLITIATKNQQNVNAGIVFINQ